MDTWWKKILYSNITKCILALGLCVASFFCLLSFAGLQVSPSEKSYYESYWKMYEPLVKKAGFVRDWIVRYVDKEIFTVESISEEQIDEYLKNERFSSSEQVVEQILNDRRGYFRDIQQELVEQNMNIEFLAINTETQQYITNIKGYNDNNREAVIKELTQRPGYIVGDGHYILKDSIGLNYNRISNLYDDAVNEAEKYTMFSYYSGDDFIGQDNYRVYVALKEVLVPGDIFYTNYNQFIQLQGVREAAYKYGISSIIVGGMILALWMVVAGKEKTGEVIERKIIDRVPFELQMIVCAVGGLWLIRLLYGGIDSLYSQGWLPYVARGYEAEEMLLLLGVSIGVIIGLIILSSCIRNVRNQSMDKYIFCIKFMKWLYKVMMTGKMMPFVVLGIMIINGGMHILFVAFTRRPFVYIVMVIIFNLLIGAVLLKVALDYRTLLRGAESIQDGDLISKVELPIHALPQMRSMANTLNDIGQGLDKAVQDSVKNERLKTELITNVSHDLKTPLTSIISYIDLLKAEEIENLAAKEYIGVLEERSNRLKQLVEDLVEASKAVTGNLQTQVEPLQLDQLVIQAIGEYSDRLEVSGIEIIAHKIYPTKVLADGRHMWRILENLLSNISKYAMPNTRAYVEVREEEHYGALIIKNISREHLDIDPDELTERFVRGDEARSTEGSGLGLAIAKSLVTLQGGTFNLSIDGDLFKVQIQLPKV